MQNDTISKAKISAKQQKNIPVKRRKYKRSKNRKLQNKNRNKNRIDKKINVYHIIRIFRKYKPLEPERIVIDPSGLKSKITIYISKKSAVKKKVLDKVPYDDSIKCTDPSETEKRLIEEDQEIFMISLNEADKILHERMLIKNAVLRSKKRLESKKNFHCMNIFEKKVVSMTSKGYKRLQADRKLQNAQNQNKDKKGGIRYRDQVKSCS